jgi:hypothetical protein
MQTVRSSSLPVDMGVGILQEIKIHRPSILYDVMEYFCSPFCIDF